MDQPNRHKITRNREFRACTECRKRKLKCDRQLPCSACARRNDALSCHYEKNLRGSQDGHGRRLQAEAKLAHLEQLVQDLSRSQESPAFKDSSSPARNARSGEGNETLSETRYDGATHWSAMLEDIEELRAVIEEEDDQGLDDSDLSDDGIGILFGAVQALPFERILSKYLPQREETDRLVATYFRSKAIVAPFLHSGSFLRLYQRFWGDPSSAPPLWTSLLFSILNVASAKTSFSSTVEGTAEAYKPAHFSEAAAHCLVAGGYHKPQEFTVEALLLFAQSRCLANFDISTDIAVVFGTLTRLATAMGYHREIETEDSGTSEFEKEMRRRAWSLCMQLDLLVSFQVGLPSNVQFPTWNSKPPTNLLDSDFDEDTVQLPPARPSLEPSELLFYIAKHSIMQTFEKVLRHTLSTADAPDDELEAIDKELRDTYAGLPAYLHPRSVADSIVDSPSIIVTRLCVTYIYHKCLCVLHRKYVIAGRQKSIKTCYDSAIDLVTLFIDFQQEFEPGGQLETERWFVGSITWHDFLLGCTALCLCVCSTRHPLAMMTSSSIVNMAHSLELLQKAKLVCDKYSARSNDTRKVGQLIGATIMRFSRQQDASGLASSALLSDPAFSSGVNVPEISLPPNEQGWTWKSSAPIQPQDGSWTSLEQFLSLPNSEFNVDGT